MICRNCNATIPDGSKFCAVCGQKAEAAPVATGCPNCGAALEPGSMFCMSCGVRLAAPAQAATPAQAPKKSSGPSKGLVAGAIAVVLVIVLLISLLGSIGGPMTKILMAGKNTLTAKNFTVEFDAGYMSGNMMVQANLKKGELMAYGEVESYGEEMILAIYDGYAITYSEEYDEYYCEDISSELEDIFEALSEGMSNNPDLEEMLEKLDIDMDDIEDVIDTKALPKCLKNLLKDLNNKKWLKENAGYSVTSSGGAKIHTFEPDMADLLVACLEDLEKAFKDEDDYEELVDMADYADAMEVELSIGVKGNKLTIVEADINGMAIEAEFSDIGKTKIDEKELEDMLDEAK